MGTQSLADLPLRIRETCRADADCTKLSPVSHRTIPEKYIYIYIYHYSYIFHKEKRKEERKKEHLEIAG
jgi:hypothetical protein